MQARLSGQKKRLATGKTGTTTSGSLVFPTSKKAKTTVPSPGVENEQNCDPSLADIPPPPPLPLPPSGPVAPTQSPNAHRTDNSLSFEFPEYNADNIQVEVKQSVSSGKKTAKALDEQCGAIKERVALLEKNVNKRIDRLQGSINYMSKCVEDFNENFSNLMDAVREQRVRDTSSTS